jgi:pimeloyl-ACP methyl ester carboxylesterase
VIVPHLRGYGTTRFLSDATPRNGQQSALAIDVIALMDALKIEKAVLGGYDWGARTANIVAALWPQRVKAMVSVSGYLIGSQSANRMPLPPKAEQEWWYQYYFATERGRAGYEQNTHDFARLIWQTASPRWASTTPPSRAAPPLSTIPITSPLRSTTTAGGSAWRRARPAMTIWSSGSPRLRRSPCRPSRWKATPTARRTRTRQLMPRSSRAGISTGPSPAASGTTLRRRRPQPSPRRSSRSIALEPSRRMTEFKRLAGAQGVHGSHRCDEGVHRRPR